MVEKKPEEEHSEKLDKTRLANSSDETSLNPSQDSDTTQIHQEKTSNINTESTQLSDSKVTNKEVHHDNVKSPLDPSITTGDTDPNNKSKFTNVTTIKDQGAMGIIQKGKYMGKWVIIKRIRKDKKNDPVYRELFYKEFENAYHLDHPHICRLLDKGEDNEGPYFFMDFVNGRPLSEYIGQKGVNSKEDALRYAKQICIALEYIHNNQVIHRDLKPDNILITAVGNTVKIIDFGIASADKFDDGVAGAGTPKYAAPEQLDKSQEVTHKSDLYSFGLILLEMFGASQEKGQITGIKNKKLKDIVYKCISSIPINRYNTADEILKDLNEVELKSANNKLLAIFLLTCVTAIFLTYIYNQISPPKKSGIVVIGSVKDDKGEKVHKAKVMADASWAFSDVNGQYSFNVESPKEYLFSCEKEGYKKYDTSLKISGQDSFMFNIILQKLIKQIKTLEIDSNSIVNTIPPISKPKQKKSAVQSPRKKKSLPPPPVDLKTIDEYLEVFSDESYSYDGRVKIIKDFISKFCAAENTLVYLWEEEEKHASPIEIKDLLNKMVLGSRSYRGDYKYKECEEKGDDDKCAVIHLIKN